MRDRLLELVERADLALGSSADVVDDRALRPFIDSVTAVRTRLAYPEEFLVVAFAGGTGSGKSSLFNSLAGAELVDVGGIRPTTSHPAAGIPKSAGDALDGYLDRLDVAERHVHDSHGLCLLDLPDTDSIEMEHRQRVDEMLPLVDVVVWVTDPEKYRDARLHNDYLKPMADYSEQLVFVLNQIDRLPPTKVGDVCADLAAALEADGLGEKSVLPVAASPPGGPPIGIDLLLEELESKREARSVLYGKLLTDLALVCRRLGDETGRSLDFDARAKDALRSAAESLVNGEAPAAIAALTSFLDSIEAETGPLISRRIGKIAATAADHVERIRRQIADSKPAPRPRWFRRRRPKDDSSDLDQARALISEAVIRPARAEMARRAVAIASIAELSLEVDKVLGEASR
jgi:hypothetical protein